MRAACIQVLTEGTIANNGITYLEHLYRGVSRARGTHVFTLLIDSNGGECMEAGCCIIPRSNPSSLDSRPRFGRFLSANLFVASYKLVISRNNVIGALRSARNRWCREIRSLEGKRAWCREIESSSGRVETTEQIVSAAMPRKYYSFIRLLLDI